MFKYFVAIVWMFCSAMVAAQGNRPKPKSAPTVAAKAIITGTVPKVKAFWGRMQEGTYNQAILSKLLDSADLYLVDEKGVVYTPLKYSFSFKSKREYVDEATEQKLVTYDYMSTNLKKNEKLDTLWRSRVKEEMKDGDEIIFENILADSKKGFALQVATITFVVKGDKAILK